MMALKGAKIDIVIIILIILTDFLTLNKFCVVLSSLRELFRALTPWLRPCLLVNYIWAKFGQKWLKDLGKF